MGKKQFVPFVRPDGTLGQRKVINFRFVLDERICDGYYYAASIKKFRRYLKHPELLERPPEKPSRRNKIYDRQSTDLFPLSVFFKLLF